MADDDAQKDAGQTEVVPTSNCDLPWPRLARRLDTAMELPAGARDLSKNLSALSFSIEHSFYDSAVALLGELEKSRLPDVN
jgi:hypothetical protein